MLKKLRLDQTKKYEQSIATYEIAKMLVAFVEGKKHILCIGAEQGDIKGWDDLIIEEADRSFTHIQVKRQQTPFSPSGYKCTRSIKRNGNERELSPLDESMKYLANWVSASKMKDVKRQFKLEIPISNVKIKDDLDVRNFTTFCKSYINSTTKIENLETLCNVQNDSDAKNIFDWMTSWCDFKDWGHILEALQELTICNSGLESDIDNRTIIEIERIFQDSHTVLQLVKSYTEDNSAYTSAIAPRQLLFKLKEFLLPNIPTWTQIQNDGRIWKVSGIHDLEDNNQIERPSIIIPLVWDNARPRHVKINTSSIDQCFAKPHEEIFQLVLHLKGNCLGYCFNWLGWKECLKNKLGGTLGLTDDDFENLNISDDTAPFEISEARILDSHIKRDEFSKDLSDEMIKTTWKLVETKISIIIDEMRTDNNSELRDAVEQRWNVWNTTFGLDNQEQRRLLKKMLHPKAEGQDILGELRIGAKATGLIAEGIYLLLIVSIALNENNQDWKIVDNDLTINVIGLNFWSGPAGAKRRVQKIDDDLSVLELIGKEESDIIIISKSTSPESEIIRKSLADEGGSNNSLASPHQPKLIVTANRQFKKLIIKGEIKPLHDFLMGIIEDKNENKNSAINNVAL
jgi:hypothetical protein